MNTPDRLTGSDISGLLNTYGMEVVTNRSIWSPITPSREYIAAPLGGEVMTLEELGKVIKGVEGPWLIEKWMPREDWRGRGNIQMGRLEVRGYNRDFSNLEFVSEPTSIILYTDFNYARRVGNYLRATSEGFVLPDHRFDYLETHEIRAEDIKRIESGEIPLPELVDYMNRPGVWISRIPEATVGVSEEALAVAAS